MTVTLDRPPTRDPGHRHAGSGSSACGVCGKDTHRRGARRAGGRPVGRAGARPPTSYAPCPARLRERQRVFDATGGVHAAALATAEGELLVVREDVGRHNAVDKVTGARVVAGQSPAEAVLVVSGRAGFELVQKAVAAGVGSLVAVGAPTSLAVHLAEEAGLVLYGFTSARADRALRLSGAACFSTLNRNVDGVGVGVARGLHGPHGQGVLARSGSFLVFTLNGLAQALSRRCRPGTRSVALATEAAKVKKALVPLVTFFGPSTRPVSGAGRETFSQPLSMSLRSAVTVSLPGPHSTTSPNPSRADDRVVAVAGEHEVGAGAGVGHVVARTEVGHVRPGPAQEGVVPGAAWKVTRPL